MTWPQARDLIYTAIITVASVAGAIALDRDVLPVRFRRRAEPREPPLWGWREVLVILLVMVSCWLFVGSLVSVLLQVGLLGEGASRALFLLLPPVLTLLCIVKILLVDLGQPSSTLGLVGGPLEDVFPALLLLAASLAPVGLVALGWRAILEAVGLPVVEQEILTDYRQYLSRGEWAAVAAHVTAGAVLAPIVEEILFRGVVFGAIRRSAGPALAAIASSAVFAAVHFSWSASVPLFVLGCLLAYAYQRSGSLYPAMVIHFAFNATTYVVALLAPTPAG